MDAVERLAELLLAKVRGAGWRFSTVLAPAMGGLVIGQEVARQARARYIFCEKENNVLVLRRGFALAPREPVLIVEDVVTRGGRVVECLEIVRRAGAQAVGVAMLVDRSDGLGQVRRAGGLAPRAELPHLPGGRRARGPREAPRGEAGELRGGALSASSRPRTSA